MAKKTKRKVSKKIVKRAKRPVIVDELINFKIPKAGKKILVAKANRYAKGNISAFLRQAATKYTPAHR